MNLIKRLRQNVGTITAPLVAASVLALNAGCAGLYSAQTFEFPERVECNPVTRFVPGDKVYYPVWAAGAGLANTARHSAIQAKGTSCLAPVSVALTLPSGLINTTMDTTLNLISWLPLEGYELFTGRTWLHPYMPFSRALRDSDDSGF